MVKIVDGVIVDDGPPRKDSSEVFIQGPTRVSTQGNFYDRPVRRCRRLADEAVCCPGPIFLGLLLLDLILGFILYYTNSRVALIFFGLCTWTISLCLHEFGHALTAYYGGDISVKEKGYLTLNPILYTNLLNSIIIPLIFLFIGGIGLPGGAVFIQTSSLYSRKWESAVSLAGPLATLLCGVILSIPFWAMTDNFEAKVALEQQHDVFWAGLAFCAFIQFSALFLNLFPLPPLDGFGAILPWLPQGWKDFYHANIQYAGFAGLIIVFALFSWVPVLRNIIVGFASLFGVSRYFIGMGSTLFRLF